MASEYDLAEAFRAVEDELMDSMMRNLARHRAEETREGFLWSQWQAEQLKALEQYRRTNKKRFGKQFQTLNTQIGELIRAARADGGMEQEAAILEAIRKGFPARRFPAGAAAEFFKLNDRKLDALVRATVRDMQRAETAVLRMANDQYRKLIYNAQVYANTGAGTYEKAVDMAARDFLSAGLNCIEYANGARHTLSDYADMAIRTASKRAYLTGEGEKRREWGISTVIMNKRGNPCPKCLPFVGKVLIDDVWSGGKRSDGPYPLMSAAIAAGLYHPRCKDSHTTYFKGVSTADDAWTEEELSEVERLSLNESREQYARRQAERFGRLARYSLDGEDKRKYAAREKQWESVANRVENDIIKLPRYEEAVIPEAKLTKYALNPIREPNKAKAFKEALGYDISNYRDLIKNIYEHLPDCAAIEKPDKGHGPRFEIVMKLTGPNGKRAYVLTGWIDDKENGEMRMTTIHIDKRRAKNDD